MSKAGRMREWINKGPRYWTFPTTPVELRYDACYVADLCILDRRGNWSDRPVAVFWRPYPEKGHSPYFGIYIKAGKEMISSAASAAEGVWHGVRAANGEIIFSRWRRDFRSSEDGTAIVDGGRDYFRGSGEPGTLDVCLKAKDKTS